MTGAKAQRVRERGLFESSPSGFSFFTGSDAAGLRPGAGLLCYSSLSSLRVWTGLAFWLTASPWGCWVSEFWIPDWRDCPECLRYFPAKMLGFGPWLLDQVLSRRGSCSSYRPLVAGMMPRSPRLGPASRLESRASRASDEKIILIPKMIKIIVNFCKPFA